jgi:hypothetical protein
MEDMVERKVESGGRKIERKKGGKVERGGRKKGREAGRAKGRRKGGDATGEGRKKVLKTEVVKATKEGKGHIH